MTVSNAEDLRARRLPDRPIAAVGALILREGRVLLVKRGQPPARGEWSIPGGVVEVGETLLEAVIREVSEETGLSVIVGPVVEVVDRIHRDAAGRVEYHYVIADFLCRERDVPTLGGSPVEPQAQTDVEDARWVAPAELSAYRITERLANVVAKAVAVACERRPG